MSAQPTALAVLDDLISDMGDTPGTTGHQVAHVRGAVAELIEAASRAAIAATRGDENRPGAIRNADLDALRAAVARVQGVQS